MNKLWVFGDSFSTNHNKKITITWPEIVADYLNLKLINTARGGCGNDEIYEKIALNMHQINKGDYAIIGMTSPLRYKMYLPDHDDKSKFEDPISLEYNFQHHSSEVDIPFIEEVMEDKIIHDYYYKIRGEAFDKHDERMTNRIIGLQKELSKRSIKSILWKWYETKDQSYQSPMAYSKYSIEDGHFGDRGHKQFADRILYKIDENVSYWKNIYEKIDNLNKLI